MQGILFRSEKTGVEGHIERACVNVRQSGTLAVPLDGLLQR